MPELPDVEVIRRYLERQVDPAHMPRIWLRHRREPGTPFPRCKGEIPRSTVGGRTTYWCPGCQR